MTATLMQVRRGSRFRHSSLLALKIVISIGSLYLIVSSVAWDDVSGVFQNLQAAWVAVALSVFWIAQGVSSLRCVYVARALGGELDFHTSLRAHFVGLWFNQVLPTSLGGDVVKIALMRSQLGLSLAFRSAVLDRFSGLAYLMAAVIAAIPLYYFVLSPVKGLVLLLGAFASAFVLGLLGVSWWAYRYPIRIPALPLLREGVQLLNDLGLFRTRRRLWEQFWTSSVVHFNGIASYALIGLAIGAHVEALIFILIVPLVFLVALLPISFAGWGVREAGAVWLFGVVGISKEQSLAMSICYGVMLVVAGLPGLFVFLRSKRARTQ